MFLWGGTNWPVADAPPPLKRRLDPPMHTKVQLRTQDFLKGGEQKKIIYVRIVASRARNINLT